MKSEIKLLVLEDTAEDFKLIERILIKANLCFHARVVDTKEEYIEALHHYNADVILSDHSIPQFNSTEALAILKQSGTEIPFIIVTGNVSEEFAVNCIKQGVDDYILKSNLERLPSAISNVLQQKENERAYRSTLQELEETNKKLVKYNQELEQFIFQVTHVLRAPLSSMLDLLQMKSREMEADDPMQAYFSMMADSIQKLDKTLVELQQHPHYSKVQLNIEPLNLSTLIEDHIERLKFMPGAESIMKELCVERGEVLYTDRYHLSVIVNNLLSNAIKYYDARKENPFIKISAAVTAEKVRVEFEDNGIGIGDEYLSKIFNMFFRATGKNEGAGLGLHIVKESVDKLAGNISVTSTLDKGTTFTIEFPNYRPAGHWRNKNVRSEKQFSKSRPAISNPSFHFNP